MKSPTYIQEFREKFGSYTEGAFYEKEDANLGEEMESFFTAKIKEAEQRGRDMAVDFIKARKMPFPNIGHDIIFEQTMKKARTESP